ncbi:unnamed protein product [Caenorhabditis brenneri]
MQPIASLMPLTAEDMEVNYERYSRKRKIASTSTTPPSLESNENVKPLDQYIAKKTTKPTKYCPKRRQSTQQVPAPESAHARRPATREEDDSRLKKFLDERPHFRVARLPEETESEDMRGLRAFRRRDYLAAQEAEKNGGFIEEPKPKKKRGTRFPKTF